MGQYYHPVILGKNKKTVLKWMNSWSYNQGAKLMEHSWLKNTFVGAFESLIYENPQIVVWAGDYAEKCSNRKTNVYNRCIEKLEVSPLLQHVKAKYIVNHTTKQFVDKSKVPSKSGWAIHPLPLLTCDSNHSGGSFHGTDFLGLVGLWSKDLISIESRKPKGYNEIFFNLVE